MSKIPPFIIKAYLETDYHVLAPLSFVMRLNVANELLAKPLQAN